MSVKSYILVNVTVLLKFQLISGLKSQVPSVSKAIILKICIRDETGARSLIYFIDSKWQACFLTFLFYAAKLGLCKFSKKKTNRFFIYVLFRDLLLLKKIYYFPGEFMKHQMV